MRRDAVEIVTGEWYSSLKMTWDGGILAIPRDTDDELLEILGPKWDLMYSFKRDGETVKVYYRKGRGSKCSL